MFRGHAFRVRASRTAYFASASVVGVIVADGGDSGNQETSVEVSHETVAQSTPVEVVPDAAAQSTPAEVVPDAATQSTPAEITTQDAVGESVLADAPASTEVSAIVTPEPPRTVFPDLPEKLSIYPNPTPTLVLLDTPSPLELGIGGVRRQLCGYYSDARTQVQGVVDRWIRVEEAVESRFKSFRDPAEPLNPGLLYTGVSALTASVIVRSRSLPVRFLLPPLSLVGTFAYFLPRTAGRVGSWVEELEDRHAPRFGKVRRTSVAHTSMALSMLGEKYREGKEGLGKGARSAVESIESSTGLRLSGAFGWTRDAGDKKGSDENKNA